MRSVTIHPVLPDLTRSYRGLPDPTRSYRGLPDPALDRGKVVWQSGRMITGNAGTGPSLHFDVKMTHPVSARYVRIERHFPHSRAPIGQTCVSWSRSTKPRQLESKRRTASAGVESWQPPLTPEPTVRLIPQRGYGSLPREQIHDELWTDRCVR